MRTNFKCLQLKSMYVCPITLGIVAVDVAAPDDWTDNNIVSEKRPTSPLLVKKVII